MSGGYWGVWMDDNPGIWENCQHTTPEGILDVSLVSRVAANRQVRGGMNGMNGNVDKQDKHDVKFQFIWEVLGYCSRTTIFSYLMIRA
jgi:hypothetical protein